ncbi:hypothetical protein METBIDRAFT_76369 [Metschnikowia bicuspidata var. bicuspidata NRRL YB-4993]|uniref:Exocyst complex component Sec3 PIP2-binding N-terminal domain-containing protein n=1 Tax=Metschnikowia bicuspidata var. bicuspidata NRRL YB-4993 TaxID=869754 RepID=A0A1A0HHI2_9ASCO|nr:hypothetical protein METBIDRAFT_76369 [Metschnikowia bicuspidata var. bicuspidata NRRL YB-4993]OBA23337.1 hypothetical protein METBIDRAFT_76369 [Metschnikowia bicuspidata var. bicuspidata NRRL YB-4993]
MPAQPPFALQPLPRQRGGPPAPVRSMVNPDPRRAVVDHIIRDCYSKLVVVDGHKVPEIKYNTHLLIREYALYPQQAPPAGLPPAQIGTVKSRVLVVCTKHTGRVLLQKGKYNEQKNVYQIGRTWDLDELTCVTRVAPDAIVLLLNKDYYWKSGDDPGRLSKFVHHLAVIYHRFTGHYPEMKGFTLESLGLPSGAAAGSQQPPRPMSKTRSSAPMPAPSPAAQKAPVGLYNDMDFTANGTLPMKPMQVMDVDRPSLNSGIRHAHETFTPTSSSHQSVDGINVSTVQDKDSMSTRNSPVKGLRGSPRKSEAALETLSIGDSHSLGSSINDIFEDSRSTMPTILEYTQKNGLLLPLRNYKPEREQARPRDVSDNLETAASYGLQLLNQLDHMDEQHDQTDHLAQAPEDTAAPDPGDEYSIEEASLTGSSIDTQIYVARQKMNEAGDRNDSVIDDSIKEIEDFMVSQFGKELNAPEHIPDQTLSHKQLLPKSLTEKLQTPLPDANDEIHPLIHEKEPTVGPDSELNTARAPEKNAKPKPEMSFKKDPEIEELLDGIGWDPTDGGEHCLKMLKKELASIKHRNILELTTLDFGKDTLANEVKISAAEIFNLVEIFEEMEVSFKMIAPQINSIEHNSKGLQIEAVNKKILFNELSEIMNKVRFSDRDLKAVANYKEFDDASMVPVLEGKLMMLYDAIRAIGINTSEKDLSQMQALKQFHQTYEGVSLSFIQRFLTFMTGEFKHVVEDLNKDVSNVFPNKILPIFRKNYIFAGVNLFVKCISEHDFILINDKFNAYMANFLDNLLSSRRNAIHSGSDSKRNSRLVNNSERLSGLKKTKSSRFGSSRLLSRNTTSNGENKIKTIEPVAKSAEEINDPRAIIRLVKESTEFMLVVQYFLGTFFHLTSEDEFSTFLMSVPFEQRIDSYDNGDTDFINYKTNSNELLRNMNSIFGNYINRFTRELTPGDLITTQVLYGLFELLTSAESKSQDFVAYSFLSKLTERYKGNWERFIAQQVDMFNKSDVRAKGDILPVVRNLNQIITTTESSLQEYRNSGLELPQITLIIGQTYALLTKAANELFSRDDPLLKSNTHDERERAHRNVAILQNMFSILQQLGEYDSPSSTNMSAGLDVTFKTVEKEYFDYIIRMYVGKIKEFRTKTQE